MKYEHDRASCISEGYREGFEQGIDKGAHQKALETAKLMKQAKCELDFIMHMTGLSKTEVENL